MKPLTQRALVIMPHQDPTRAVSVDAFIDRQAARLDAAALRQLSALVNRLMEKSQTDQARCHYDLVEGIQILSAFLESDACAEAVDPLPRAFAEAAAAGFYILKGRDLIPDSLPEIGLTDDARILARVLERNPEIAIVAKRARVPQ